MNRLKKFLVKGLVISSALALVPTAFAMKEEKPKTKKLDDYHALMVISKYLGTYEDPINVERCCKEHEGIVGGMHFNRVPLNRDEFEKVRGWHNYFVYDEKGVCEKKNRFDEYHVYGTREDEFKPKSFAELPECISGIVYEPGSFDANFFVQVLGNCHNPEISVEKFDGRCECIKLTEGELDYGFKVIIKFKDKSENEKRIEFRVNLGGLMLSEGSFSIKGGVKAYNSALGIFKDIISSGALPDEIDLAELLMKINKVTIPESVTSIGKDCFDSCKSLTTINIPNSVTSIGEAAFWDCKNLTTINIPNSVTSLGNSCFANCENLKTISIPSGVTSLGDNCFDSCKSLTTINIPNSVTSIGYRCFADCKNLNAINIPSGVTSLGDCCFYGCENLKRINIPSGVTSLGGGCFSECKNLTTINIPDSVTSLGDFCFSGCENLKTINIPSGVTSLGDFCFYGCSLDLKIKRYGGEYTLRELTEEESSESTEEELSQDEACRIM